MTEEKNNSSWRHFLHFVFSFIYVIILPLAIIATAVWIYKYQVDTKPKASHKAPQRHARLIEITTVDRTDSVATVKVNGTVIAAQEVTINPEVAGRIVYVNAAVVPGGIVKKDDILFEIDRRDYEYTYIQRKAELAQAQLDLKLEAGNQTLAKQEFELLGEVIDKTDEELVLRKPHLASAQAAVEAAQAAVDKAKLDIERCTIKAPFNAIVQEKLVEIGTRVSQSTAMVKLAGTDQYWIKALVPLDELNWINFPADGQTGSSVTINNVTWFDEQSRKGNVLNLISDLEPNGRHARVLITVDDPLALKSNDGPALLIGSFVQSTIRGKTIPSVIPISWEYLREGSTVWIMNKDNQLEIRPVKIVFTLRDEVFISEGIEAGERLVTTNIAAPVEDMPLRTAEMQPEEEPAKEAPYDSRKDR